jgi:hypothetical protein
MEKDKEIKKKIKELETMLQDVVPGKKKLCDGLIANAAFMSVSLLELQDQINKNGMVSEYQNGANQWGTKKSPEIEVYATMIKNYSTIMKQLIDLFPDEAKEAGGVMQWIKETR